MEQFLHFLFKSPFNLLLFVAAVISGGLLIAPLFTRGLRAASEVSPAEAVNLINRKDAVVIDVRNDSDYAAGHINNARHLPEAKLGERQKELDRLKGKPVIVSCDSGRRAAAVAATLRKQGFEEVVALRGGIAAWQQAGMPLEK